MNKHRSPKVNSLPAILFWGLVWFLAASAWDNPLLLPGPLQVLRRLAELAATGAFWQITLVSIGRILLGVLWGVALGVVLAVLGAGSRLLYGLLAPAMTVNTLLLLTNGLKVYDLPYALTKGGPGYSNYTVTQIIIQRGISEHQYGVSTALAAIFILLVMIISVLQYTSMRKREVEA